MYSESYCYKNISYFKECDIHVDFEMQPFQILFLEAKLSQYSNEITSKYAYTNHSILENEQVRLQFLHTTDSGDVRFNYTLKENNVSEAFNFEFRYYEGVESGHY